MKEWSEKSSSRCKEFLADVPSDSELHRSIEALAESILYYGEGFLIESDFPMMESVGIAVEMKGLYESGNLAKPIYNDYLTWLTDFWLDYEKPIITNDFKGIVDRSYWIIAGHLLYDNRFEIFDHHNAGCLHFPEKTYGFYWFRSAEEGDRFERLYTVHGYLNDPDVAKEALAYIQQNGRAADIVRRWLLEDINAAYAEKEEPKEAFRNLTSVRKHGLFHFRNNAEDLQSVKVGNKAVLHLVGTDEMDFDPEITARTVVHYEKGHEIRATSWYRNKRWLLRLIFDNSDSEKASVVAYELGISRPHDLHILSFIERAGDYPRDIKAVSPGLRFSISLTDLWGRDVDLPDCTVTNVYPCSFNAEAVFPDGKSRVLSVYINPNSSNYEDDAPSIRTNAGYISDS